MFKIELIRLSSLQIGLPAKMCKSRRDLPWIAPQILRLSRKQDKMYTKLKHLNTSATSIQFKDLKYNIQNQLEMLIGCTLNLSYSQAIHNHIATRSSTHLLSTIKQNNVALLN